MKKQPDKLLKVLFPIPVELYPLWIRYIEKAALPEELPKINELTRRLVRAKILTIGALLELTYNQLSSIPHIEKNSALLFVLLKRISVHPQIVSPVKKTLFDTPPTSSES
ncbi:hypothetical protein [Paenibacillus sp. DMB5]|uniref:hypothetical protein n=1 Tax=Paenibacillus sp. DMB5 TaxID=1780103 RepID=UPI000FE1405C|nr:hypothetical protein [Paenibacillus sp. DMB5]